ncbi:MAG: DUF4281 domain-containing protein [Alphaproteobacteria bacterium]|nr:DUF4281 domain-containing protein [Alphaproteobacteria bacterium]
MPVPTELSADDIYQILNLGVLPFWALIILVPFLRITDTLVHSVFAPIVLGVIYGWLLANVMAGAVPMPEGAGFASLDALMRTFSVKEAVVAGWAHYIVFDLFVGAWIARDAQRIGLNQFIVAPALILTLLVGPIGLLTYLLIRGISGRGGWSLFEG